VNNRGPVYSYTEEKDNKDRVLALLDSRLCWMELKPREKDFKDRVLTRQDSLPMLDIVKNYGRIMR
jgi:hypothetical protein